MQEGLLGKSSMFISPVQQALYQAGNGIVVEAVLVNPEIVVGQCRTLVSLQQIEVGHQDTVRQYMLHTLSEQPSAQPERV